MTAPSTRTGAQIILQAMQNATLIGEEYTIAPPDAIARYLPRLNDLMNAWQVDGVKPWLEQEISLPLQVGKEKYSIGPGGDLAMYRPLKSTPEAYFIEPSGARRALIKLEKDQYKRLTTPLDGGAVTQFYVEPRVASLDVYLWSVPDAFAVTGEVRLQVQTQVDNFNLLGSGAENVSFPPEWYIALHWGLADEICIGQPQAIVDRCTTKALFYKDKLEGWDAGEGSIYFTPDTQRSR